MVVGNVSFGCRYVFKTHFEMNTWEYKPLAIVEADDFMDRYDRNGLNFLFYWKAKYPDFKITLFTVPDKTTPELLLKLSSLDLCEFAMHGFNHESNFECYGWDYDKTMSYIDRVEKMGYYKKIFKAPGWTITPGYNGYPADEKDAINKNVQAVYEALRDRDYIIFDRHYNKKARPEGCKIVCADCQTKLVHMHTWDTPGPVNERNGFVRVEEDHGVPWDSKTDFYLVSDAWDRGLFDLCKD